MLFFKIRKSEAFRDGKELLEIGEKLLEEIERGVTLSKLEKIASNFEKKYLEMTSKFFLSFYYLRGYLDIRKEIDSLVKRIHYYLFDSCYSPADPLGYFLGLS